MLVGLLLCPYRNLTTLTCATLALHPRIQVMNHGLARVAAEGGLGFLERPEPPELDRLARALVALSVGGERGTNGGSILLSHAFDHPEMAAAYRALHGEAALKPAIGAVVWKEGGRLREAILGRGLDPVTLAERLPALRFLSPMRHPLDHASSLATFYANGIPPFLQGSLPDLQPTSLLRYILRSHRDFLGWHRRRPDRFLWFTEAGMGRPLLVQLAHFLGVEPDPIWLEHAFPVFTSKRRYDHPPELQASLDAVLAADFGGDPAFATFVRERLCAG